MEEELTEKAFLIHAKEEDEQGTQGKRLRPKWRLCAP